MQQHLRICLRAEHVTARFEVSPERPVIIDFAIEGYDHLPVRARHRLQAAVREVDYRKTSTTEAYSPILRAPHSCAVWPASRHVVAHEAQLVPIDRVCG